MKTTKEAGFNFVELNLAGFDRPHERHGNKFIVTAPGYRMKYVSHQDERNEKGRVLSIITRDPVTEVQVHSFWQFYDGIPVVRMYHRIENHGTQPQTIDYVSTFNYTGIEKEGLGPEDEKLRLWISHNGWQRELNWKEYSLKDLGMGGPNELYSHWFKTLKPGESFITVPAAVGVSAKGFDDSMAALTKYRRLIRRKNRDNETCL